MPTQHAQTNSDLQHAIVINISSSSSSSSSFCFDYFRKNASIFRFLASLYKDTTLYMFESVIVFSRSFTTNFITY